ncbi:MAG: type II toxin-antitoxin system Phd/YefM family antitoxin [Acidimicrobiaceae bacterium]|nr:type II toxin-antitoxin system Phd/YefM family antitoxin [Acidimicrobiaceae bacterium]
MATHDLTTPTTAPLTDVRRDLSEIIDEVGRTGAEFIVTKHGRPVAAIVPHDELEVLLETLNILSDPETMEAIAQSETEIEAGDLIELDDI